MTWYDWKKLLTTKFINCPGISGWHVVHIVSEGNNIQVANFINQPFTNVKIMNENVILEERPDVIEPEDFKETRIQELDFFTNYVLEGHKELISNQY